MTLVSWKRPDLTTTRETNSVWGKKVGKVTVNIIDDDDDTACGAFSFSTMIHDKIIDKPNPPKKIKIRAPQRACPGRVLQSMCDPPDF